MQDTANVVWCKRACGMTSYSYEPSVALNFQLFNWNRAIKAFSTSLWMFCKEYFFSTWRLHSDVKNRQAGNSFEAPYSFLNFNIIHQTTKTRFTRQFFLHIWQYNLPFENSSRYPVHAFDHKYRIGRGETQEKIKCNFTFYTVVQIVKMGRVDVGMHRKETPISKFVCRSSN